jgi:hypothetical protein
VNSIIQLAGITCAAMGRRHTATLHEMFRCHVGEQFKAAAQAVLLGLGAALHPLEWVHCLSTGMRKPRCALPPSFGCTLHNPLLLLLLLLLLLRLTFLEVGAPAAPDKQRVT